MKTSIFTTALAFFISLATFAQDRTTVTAKSYDISDNLDLRAVASIFGESANLEDFERRLNDPGEQISNLDLNGDNQVDYLRVIESVEGNTHLIILQSVLDKDVYQDVATIEVERSGNDVQVQVVGDVYMYGQNYIYEPVYATPPVIYSTFWVAGYRPYYSNWYWGYYPSYWSYWNPYPVFRYRNRVHNHINIHNHYYYVNTRSSRNAVALHRNHRANGWEVRNPGRSFQTRNSGVTNHRELSQNRGDRNSSLTRTGGRDNVSSGRNTKVDGNSKSNGKNVGRSSSTAVRKGTSGTRSNTKSATPSRQQTVKSNSGNATRSKDISTPRSTRSEVKVPSNAPTRTQSSPVRSSQPSPSATQPTPRPSQPVQRASQPAPQRISQPVQRASQPAPQRSAPSINRSQAPQPQRQAAPAPRPSQPSSGERGGR